MDGRQACDRYQQQGPAPACAGFVDRIDARHPLREQVEQFIRQRYRQAYGARLVEWMPTLCARIDALGQISAAAGLRLATSALFVEQYLDCPVEAALHEHFGVRPERAQIVEIGHLSGGGAGAALRLFADLGDALQRAGIEWAVFAATSSLRKRLAMLGAAPALIAPARPQRLGQDAELWGSYYESDPWVVAGPVRLSRQFPRTPR